MAWRQRISDFLCCPGRLGHIRPHYRTRRIHVRHRAQRRSNPPRGKPPTTTDHPPCIMNAFLLTACVSQFEERTGALREFCLHTILHDGTETQARAQYEAEITQHYHNEHAGPPKIELLLAAPVLPELLTESGPVPIDWPQLSAEAFACLEATQDWQAEQGCWIDCDQTVSALNLAADAAALRGQLPADLVGDLNWQPERLAFFVLSALKPSAAPAPRLELEDLELTEAQQREATFPELVPREMVAVVKARNAVVAAWLWRCHAQTTPWAPNRLRLDGWPGAEPCAAAPIPPTGPQAHEQSP